MHKVLALGLTLTVALALPAHAQTPQRFVYGEPNCGDWVKSPNLMRQGWFIGFISGMNVASNDWPDPILPVGSANQLLVWMDNWCKENPLEGVGSGVAVLMRELRAKAQKQQ